MKSSLRAVEYDPMLSGDQRPAIPDGPIDDPACWTGADYQASTAWQYRFDGTDLAELEAALAGVRKKGLQIAEINKVEFPLPRLSRKLREIRHDVLDGRGFTLLRGLPVDEGHADAAAMYWGIGSHLGYAVPQNARGQLLGHVTDLGEMTEDVTPPERAEKAKVFFHTKTRGYNTRSRFFFHMDFGDIVGLCCLHPARSGGESLIVSSIALHNEIMKQRPDLLRVLYEPFWVSRQHEIPAGMQNCYQMPVFNYFEGRLTTHYLPLPIKLSESFPEYPKLTEQQKEAMTLLDTLAEDPRFHISMTLEQGDIQLLNNHVTLHTRTAYEDYVELNRRRHLLRLWLVAPDGRPLPDWFYLRCPGGRRGGVYVPGVKEVASLEP